MEQIMNAEQLKACELALKQPVSMSLADAKKSVDLYFEKFNASCVTSEDVKHRRNAVKARQFSEQIERLPKNGEPALKVQVQKVNGKTETWLFTGLRADKPAGKRFRIEA